MPHTIRLRGPWECQPQGRWATRADGPWQLVADDLPAGGTAEMPADWGGILGTDFRGVVRFTRRFHGLTGLETDNVVWLVIEDIDWQAEVTLNGRPLARIVSRLATVSDSDVLRCPVQLDITTALQPQNLLEITVASPQLAADGTLLPRAGREGEPGGLVGLVRLEIE